MPRVGFQTKEICCVGGGYVGGSSSAVLALQVPEVNVTVVDKDASRVASWNSNALPFSEPGLLDAVLKARDGVPTAFDHKEESGVKLSQRPNLFFSTDVDNAIRKADLIFVAVETPSEPTESGDGAAYDLSSFNAVIRRIGEMARRDFILVNKSTVPCGTADETKKMLATFLHPRIQFEVLSNPEFLAEGTAVQDLLHPDRIIVGSLQNGKGLKAAGKLVDLYATWVPREKIMTMSTKSSELSKVAANALLAQRISSINAISAICDELGADITEVSHACGLDHRIGPHMLKATVGFGGSCFKKDLLQLSHTASHLKLHDVASYWKMVLSMNNYQTNRFINRIASQVPNSTGTKVVAILGFAFKAGTDDTRESPAIKVICSLLQKEYFVRIFDPLVQHSKILEDLRIGLANTGGLNSQHVTVCSSVYEACEGAHAVAILTELESLHFTAPITTSQEINGSCMKTAHSEIVGSTNGPVHGERCPSLSLTRMKPETDMIQRYAEKEHEAAIQWEQVADIMQEPKYICDGHNILDRRIASLGFTIDGVGRRGQADSRNQTTSHITQTGNTGSNGIDTLSRTGPQSSIASLCLALRRQWVQHLAFGFIKPQSRRNSG